MLLCITSQGLITVPARDPPSAVIQESLSSVLSIILNILLFFPRLLYQQAIHFVTDILHILLFFPRLLYQVLKSLITIFHILLYLPYLLYQAFKSLLKTLTYPLAKLVSHLARSSKHHLKSSDKETTTTSPVPNAIATLQPLNESDMFDSSACWREECCSALQAVWDVHEGGEMDGELLDEDIVGLRELEGKAWGDGEGCG